MHKDMVKLGIDLSKGKVQNYSADQANETLRKAFCDLLEISDNGKIDYKTFRRHKVEVFEILEEIIEEVINEGLEDQFSDFAEYRNLAWGDTNKFIVPDNQLFRVARVSDGNGNIRRQRLRDGEEYIVTPEVYAIKIYEEFYRFLAGRINWMDMVNKISQSFTNDLTEKIYQAIMSSYGQYGAEYHKVVSNLDPLQLEEELIETAMHIQARTGENVAVYGTKLALRKITPSVSSDSMKDAYNNTGFYGRIAGIDLREIKQSHKIGTDEFVIDNNFVLLLPQNVDKMVKIVNEGETIIQETEGGKNADMAMEYLVTHKFGIAVICSKAFGFLKFE